MGDRNNPIKFGPEWLRNLPRERSAGRTSQSTRTGVRSGSQGPVSSGAGGTTGASGGVTGGGPTAQAGSSPDNASALRSSPVPSTSTGATTRVPHKVVPKVQLAKLRYGREEMLALYDRTTEAPEELRYFDLLYQPRGKPPVALNTFEEDMRDTIRGPIAMTTERFGVGRGSGRGVVAADVRGKSRMPFVRHSTASPSGRGSASLHSGNVRSPGYVGPEEDGARPWSANNGSAPTRTGEQSDWPPNKMFRRRQANHTNWRQTSRDEGDEWRNQDGSRPTNRSNLDKWDRDWSERPAQDRPQSWNTNRRTWGGDTQSEDNLPEWAVDSAEAGAGTFDSTGAFHGYSNDDSNLPKTTQEIPYQLTRSQTHGSFTRSKTAEEGSDEWWASEKAKKLSPKRFDTGEPKFKKTSVPAPSNTSPSDPVIPTNIKKVDLNALEELSEDEQLDKLDREKHKTNDDNQSALRQKFSESKTFDALMRSDIGFTESDERSNFQSVIISSGNSLRQTHQSVVTPEQTQAHSAGLLHILHGIPIGAQSVEPDSTQSEEVKIVEDLIDMTEDKPLAKIAHKTPSNITNITNMTKPMPPLSSQLPIMQMNSVQQLPASMPIQNIGIPNPALNSSLGLPMPQGTTGLNNINTGINNGMVMPMQGNLPAMQNSGLNPIGSMQSQSVIGGFQGNGVPGMPTPNLANNSLFMGQNNPTLPSNEIQNNLFPMMQTQPYGSLYGNIVPQAQNTSQSLVDQWFYEDPKKIIQGPFPSKDMYSWYRAGFFSPGLMVRRACDAHMRPLGSYGPVVPFAQLDVMSPFPMGGFESRPQGNRDLLNQQPPLAIEDSLWGQPGPSQQDLMWMQAITARNETRVNNLPMFFWDAQPASAISSNSLLPEEIAKEMKTEEEILAQLRASQNIPTTFLNGTTSTTTTFTSTTATFSSTTATFTSTATQESFQTSATPDMGKLEKLMPDALTSTTEAQKQSDPETKPDKAVYEQTVVEQKPAAPKAQSDIKPKANPKDNGAKVKKMKEDVVEVNKEDEVKSEKASAESSPTKTKKEDKPSKKELEKEKKEWIKEGFTIVKGPEKNTNKDNKKKVEEARVVEDAERKKKEEEKLTLDEEKKKKIAEAIRKQQLEQKLNAESLSKRAPWSSSQPPTNRDGLTLAEIQRMEREKKLEQMKEQQQMMQIIAQKQADALATEQVLQEMQQNPAWAKSKKVANNSISHSLAVIQAETRRLSAAIAQTEEPPAPQINNTPWNNAHNGFWDTQPNASITEKTEKVEQPEVKMEKKRVTPAPKKESSPVAEFEGWCNTCLTPWNSKIDVPTFVGFLKDIESPYEVKDYVKCYLGESKDSNDFARQFLERRSKLLRVGTVTPSDDLCSPAVAINPRASLVDYQEVKGKGKKSKKNKMLKVDARILGFSVTASEDRINVGDIDTV